MCGSEVKCEGCIYASVDIATNDLDCEYGLEPEWNDAEEEWECEKFCDAEKVAMSAYWKHYDRLEEQGKNEAKGVYD